MRCRRREVGSDLLLLQARFLHRRRGPVLACRCRPRWLVCSVGASAWRTPRGDSPPSASAPPAVAAPACAGPSAAADGRARRTKTASAASRSAALRSACCVNNIDTCDSPVLYMKSWLQMLTCLVIRGPWHWTLLHLLHSAAVLGSRLSAPGWRRYQQTRRNMAGPIRPCRWQP